MPTDSDHLYTSHSVYTKPQGHSHGINVWGDKSAGADEIFFNLIKNLINVHFFKLFLHVYCITMTVFIQ